MCPASIDEPAGEILPEGSTPFYSSVCASGKNHIIAAITAAILIPISQKVNG